MLRTVYLFLVASVLALPGAVPAAALTDLTPAQRAERIKALPAEDRKWVEDTVAPIILPEEVQVFLQLTEPAQRERFKNAFWARREQPTLQPPLGPGYRTRYEHLREIAASDFDGLQQEAGKLVVRQGEPDSIQNFTDCNELFKWVELWTYTRDKGGVAAKTLYLFYRPSVGAPRR